MPCIITNQQQIFKIYKNIIPTLPNLLPTFIDFDKRCACLQFYMVFVWNTFEFFSVADFVVVGRKKNRRIHDIHGIEEPWIYSFKQKYLCSFLLFIKRWRSCDLKVLHLKNDEGGLLSGKFHKRCLSSWMILAFFSITTTNFWNDSIMLIVKFIKNILNWFVIESFELTVRLLSQFDSWKLILKLNGRKSLQILEFGFNK